jgi:hypothetical protein
MTRGVPRAVHGSMTSIANGFVWPHAKGCSEEVSSLMSKWNKYHQLYDGDWVLITRRNHRHMCCDCALVHVIDIRDCKDGTEVRFRRDNRATAAARRPFEFIADDD